MANYKVKTDPITQGVLVGVQVEGQALETGNTDAAGQWTHVTAGDQDDWQATMRDPAYRVVPPSVTPVDLDEPDDVITFLISEV